MRRRSDVSHVSLRVHCAAFRETSSSSVRASGCGAGAGAAAVVAVVAAAAQYWRRSILSGGAAALCSSPSRQHITMGDDG